MAAEALLTAGYKVDLYESMPTLGRKFLRAGLGGLNITHSEDFADFCLRYGSRQTLLRPYLERFKPDKLRDWVHNLGIETFVGTSGRVFPKEMKAAPLLRAWLHRLRAAGLIVHNNHLWLGFNSDGALRFKHAEQELVVKPAATILALGGASWPQLGSTGLWLFDLQNKGLETAPWRPANCGFEVNWSEHLQDKFDGQPLKSVSLTFCDLDKNSRTRVGELLVKRWGLEGSLVYAFASSIRDYIEANGAAQIYLDLVPDKSAERVLSELTKSAGSKKGSSISRQMQSLFGSSQGALKRALLYELVKREDLARPEVLAKNIKALPVKLLSPRPIAEAISTAGGVMFESLDDNLMLKNMPGVFAAGEMLDWEAPTGGYLLTACLATGLAAGEGAAKWLNR